MRTFTLLACVFLTISCATITRADLSDKSSIDDILDALDARGQGLKSFSADVKLTDTDTATGDATTRSGKVVYQAGDTPRIHVTFDTKAANGKIKNEKIEYLLKGSDLIDRNYTQKIQSTHHVLKPGEKMNLLKLGEGPFPLPIGQKKEDVHAQFDVTKVDPVMGDPPGTIHLQLVPKPDTRFAKKFKSIDAWVNVKDAMPLRIATQDINGTATRSTDLSNVQVNTPVTDADFTLPKIDEGQWQMVEDAYN